MEQKADIKDVEKKRKHGDISSVSETDTSFNLSQKLSEEKEIKSKYSMSNAKEKKKERKRKKKAEKDGDTETDDTIDDNEESIGKRVCATEEMMKSIHTELTKINAKIETIITKGEIEHMIKTMFEEKLSTLEMKIKESVYKSVTHRLDKVEGEIHTMNIEFDKLQKKNTKLNQILEDKDNEIRDIHAKCENTKREYARKTNELEQYTRRNSIRLTGPGIPKEGENKENASETTETVVKLLNDKLSMNISAKDIDISHRMGITRVGTPRNIIVKFTSRLSKIAALKDKRKKLKDTGIYIQEDLTQLNAKVLKQARESEETESAWSFEGQIYVKYKANGNVGKIQFEEYENWLR